MQGTDSWQAQCYTAGADSTTAMADFGDNLTSGALKAGTPIRVEVGLVENSGIGITMDGFQVVKLQPSLTDKDSAYGTIAVSNSQTGFAGVTQVFPYSVTNPETGLSEQVGIRVFDLNAKFSLFDDTTRTYVVPENTTMSAEVNASGAIVYGFNWGISGQGEINTPEAGTYTLNFNAPDVLLNAVSPGSDSASTGLINNHTASITFVVGASPGGTGGSGNGNGGSGGSGGSGGTGGTGGTGGAGGNGAGGQP